VDVNINVAERKGYVTPAASTQWLPFPFAKWFPVSLNTPALLGREAG
jgi:hypothetical protein